MATESSAKKEVGYEQDGPIPVGPLETSYVFLDTQIFVAKHFNYKASVFESLAKWVKGERVVILLTEITKNEVASKIREYVASARAAFNQLRRTEHIGVLDNLSNQFSYVLSKKLNVEDTVRELVGQFDRFCEEMKVEVVPLEPQSINPVFERYFSQRPPFSAGKKKDEFPDAFVLFALESWCKTNNKKVYVVSGDGDMKSFCTQDGPLLHLQNLDDLLHLLVANEQPRLIFFFLLVLMNRQRLSVIEQKIVELFPDLNFYLDEIEGEVLRVKPTESLITRWGVTRIEDGRAIFDLEARIMFAAKIRYPDVVIEDVILSTKEEVVERGAIVPLEAHILFDYNDQNYFELENLEFLKDTFVLSSGPTDYQVK